MVMSRMICAAIFMSVAAAPVAAQSPMDRMFPDRSGCYLRQYSPDHLAKHPEQRVTRIALTAEADVADPMLGLWVDVTLRGVPGGEYLALAYCENIDDTLYCSMEGDAGAFTITPRKDGAILIEVGRYGMSFENEAGFVSLEQKRGDDRSFLLQKVACS